MIKFHSCIILSRFYNEYKKLKLRTTQEQKILAFCRTKRLPEREILDRNERGIEPRMFRLYGMRCKNTFNYASSSTNWWRGWLMMHWHHMIKLWCRVMMHCTPWPSCWPVIHKTENGQVSDGRQERLCGSQVTQQQNEKPNHHEPSELCCSPLCCWLVICSWTWQRIETPFKSLQDYCMFQTFKCVDLLLATCTDLHCEGATSLTHTHI